MQNPGLKTLEFCTRKMRKGQAVNWARSILRAMQNAIFMVFRAKCNIVQYRAISCNPVQYRATSAQFQRKSLLGFLIQLSLMNALANLA